MFDFLSSNMPLKYEYFETESLFDEALLFSPDYDDCIDEINSFIFLSYSS